MNIVSHFYVINFVNRSHSRVIDKEAQVAHSITEKIYYNIYIFLIKIIYFFIHMYENDIISFN